MNQSLYYYCVQGVSRCVQYSVINMLYSYAYTVRLFNGDHYDLPLQAAQVREAR